MWSPKTWPKRHWRAALTAVAGCAMMAVAGSAAADRIGAPVIVVNSVTGKLDPGAPPRVLRVGIDVFANETIKTEANSAARLVFEDKTVLEIAASSEVRLDSFVFDPNPAKSHMTLSITQGVVRFATGVLPSSAYEIHTPSATLGVRGTVFTIDVSKTGTSCIVSEQGTVIVAGKGKEKDKKVGVEAGNSSCVPLGGAPTSPAPGRPPQSAIHMLAVLSQAAAPGGGVTPGGVATTLFGAAGAGGSVPAATRCVSPSRPGGGC